jgi:hypothetical protein
VGTAQRDSNGTAHLRHYNAIGTQRSTSAECNTGS